MEGPPFELQLPEEMRYMAAAQDVSILFSRCPESPMDIEWRVEQVRWERRTRSLGASLARGKRC